MAFEAAQRDSGEWTVIIQDPERPDVVSLTDEEVERLIRAASDPSKVIVLRDERPDEIGERLYA